MRLRTYIFIFLTALSGTVFLASCLNEENKIPPNCYDGLLNNGENPQGFTNASGAVMFDCGGPCTPCDHCVNGVFEPWEDEDWRDCGGECPPCVACNNGILDAGEVGIDCGGDCDGCELLCNDGLLNGLEDAIDCENETDPLPGGCEYCPTCIDNILNGSETGIDCGGPNCEPCCSTGNCTNGLTDGAEFNLNCGGNICHDCPDTLTWKIGTQAYFTPSILIVKNQTPTILAYTDCPAFKVGGTPLATGALSLLVTEPANGWTANFGVPLIFPPLDPTEYTVAFTDDTGEVYSSSFLDGSGKITMIKVASIVIPDDNFDGCHKPAGLYEYYRGTFSGTLKSMNAMLPPQNCSLGSFQVTFFTP